MELLERDDALAALEAARAAAAGGSGRVALVSGEPGIGKTSLVSRFVGTLGRDARTLSGTCDDLSIPRPLGPFRDVGGSLAAAIDGGAAPHELQSLLLEELIRPPRPTVLVLEDVHWADDATLDTITVLGRRIAALPALVVLTFRSGEAPPGHLLRATIGAIPPEHTLAIELAPLSHDAVRALAGADADAVYAATGGNPFYVAELLELRADGLPQSVSNAVLGRASKLDAAARRLVELVSVVPNRTRTSLLDAVMPGWAGAAVEPERRALIDVEATHVRFRHELTRNAIRSSLAIADRRRLHGQILDALVECGGDPAEIVHHAEAAGAEDVVAEYALVAARRAAALSSNREAYSHYTRAAQFADRLTVAEQAAVHEELANAAYVAGRIDETFVAIDRAIDLFRRAADPTSVGRCTRLRSRFHWFAGDGDGARRSAREAITILEPLGQSAELARAYSTLSQLGMLAEHQDDAFTWGERALDLAARLGDEKTRAHALINVGSARLQLDPDDFEMLHEAHALAHRIGDRHEATRALVNLAYTLMVWARAPEAERSAEAALAYAHEHEQQTFISYTRLMLAWLRLRSGATADAERITLDEIARDPSVSQILGKTVLAELAVRRGDADAPARIAELAVLADETGEFQRSEPVFELELEWALTHATPLPLDRLDTLVVEMRSRGRSSWGTSRVAAFAAVAGVDTGIEPRLVPPFDSMAAGDWRSAADDFGAIGWSHDRALMLSLCDDEDALVEALAIARDLGAQPLAHRVATRLRERGLRVPPGARESTRSNPAGLTARQLEVLALLVEGLTNAEIAERLVVSQRTAEHHVAAVLTKLGAATRRDAARRAAELSL